MFSKNVLYLLVLLAFLATRCDKKDRCEKQEITIEQSFFDHFYPHYFKNLNKNDSIILIFTEKDSNNFDTGYMRDLKYYPQKEQQECFNTEDNGGIGKFYYNLKIPGSREFSIGGTWVFQGSRPQGSSCIRSSGGNPYIGKFCYIAEQNSYKKVYGKNSHPNVTYKDSAVVNGEVYHSVLVVNQFDDNKLFFAKDEGLVKIEDVGKGIVSTLKRSYKK